MITCKRCGQLRPRVLYVEIVTEGATMKLEPGDLCYECIWRELGFKSITKGRPKYEFKYYNQFIDKNKEE